MMFFMMAMCPMEARAQAQNETTVTLSKGNDGSFSYSFTADKYGQLTVSAPAIEGIGSILIDSEETNVIQLLKGEQCSVVINPKSGASLPESLDLTVNFSDPRPQVITLNGVTATFANICDNEFIYEPAYQGEHPALAIKRSHPVTKIIFNCEDDYKITFDYVIQTLGMSLYANLDRNVTDCYNYNEPLQPYHYDSGVLTKGQHTLVLKTSMPFLDGFIYNFRADNVSTCANHQFTVKTESPTYLKTAANCTSPAEYYYACSVCGRSEENDNHTFFSKGLGHDFGEGHIDGTCSVCHETIPLYQGDDDCAIPTDVDDIFLSVETAVGAKLVTTGTGAMLYKGTKINIPIRSEGDVFSVETTDGSTNYTMKCSASSKTVTGSAYTASSFDGGYAVVIEATEDLPLKSIKVQQAEAGALPALTATCNFAAMAQNAVNIDHTEGSTVKGGIHWEIWANEDCKSYRLEITGQGAMKDYRVPDSAWEGTTTPWSVANDDGYYATSVTVGDGITRVGDQAFASTKYGSIEYRHVTNLRLPEGLTSIGFKAFRALGNEDTLQEFVIPSSVKYISANALNLFCAVTLRFANNSQIEAIGDYALSGDFFGSSPSKLQNVIFTGANPPKIGQNILSYNADMNVYYPEEWGITFRNNSFGSTGIAWQGEKQFYTKSITWDNVNGLASSEGAVITIAPPDSVTVADGDWWYTLTAPETGRYVITAPNANTSKTIVVYPSLSSANAIAYYSGRGYAAVDMVAGETYYYRPSKEFTFEVRKALYEGTFDAYPYGSNKGTKIRWAYNDATRTLSLSDNNNGSTAVDGRVYAKFSLVDQYAFQVFSDILTTVRIEEGITDLYEYTFEGCTVPTIILPKTCRGLSSYAFDCTTYGVTVGNIYLSADVLTDNTNDNNPELSASAGSNYYKYLLTNSDKDVYFLSTYAYNQVVNLLGSINADRDILLDPHVYWGKLHAPITIQAKIGEADPVDIAAWFDDGSPIGAYTFTASDLRAKGIDPCAYIWKNGAADVTYGDVITGISHNIVLVATPAVNHIYKAKQLAALPDDKGLYDYICDNDCGTKHAGYKVVKDYTSSSNLELNVDAQGTLSTTQAIVLTDANQFKDVNASFTAPSAATYTRTQTTQWSTLVLPFDINAQQTGYEFYSIRTVANNNGSSVVVLDKNLGDGNGIIAAGTSLFVLRTGESSSLQLTATNTTVNTAITDGSLKGNYKDVALTKADDGNYFIYNDALYNANQLKAGQTVTIKPFHAYLAGEANNADQLHIEIGGDATTIDALEDCTWNMVNGTWYNLQGQKITAPQRGINIINGTKVLVK